MECFYIILMPRPIVWVTLGITILTRQRSKLDLNSRTILLNGPKFQRKIRTYKSLCAVYSLVILNKTRYETKMALEMSAVTNGTVLSVCPTE